MNASQDAISFVSSVKIAVKLPKAVYGKERAGARRTKTVKKEYWAREEDTLTEEDECGLQEGDSDMLILPASDDESQLQGGDASN